MLIAVHHLHKERVAPDRERLREGRRRVRIDVEVSFDSRAELHMVRIVCCRIGRDGVDLERQGILRIARAELDSLGRRHFEEIHIFFAVEDFIWMRPPLGMARVASTGALDHA
eukprot:scaffold3421_cov163-Pinguiococcus_pyrenoidosus.AAC.2